MKKIRIAFLATTLILMACGGGGDKPDTENTSSTDKVLYSVKENTSVLKWTAYKTTEKTPVGGEFTEVNLTNIPSSEQAHKAIEGLAFSVPVSSLFTNNDIRDNKIINLFFGVMANTELIAGTFKTIEGTETQGHGVIDLKMNEVACDLPFNYKIKDNLISISSQLNIRSWKAENALDSLNSACYDLHKGADGISKTWEDVDIDASVELIKK